MLKSIELLIKLQEEINAEKKLLTENLAIPEKIKRLKEKLSAARSRMAKADEAEKKNLTDRINLEQDIKLSAEKQKKMQEQLMGVKDNEQYKAMTKQIKYIDKEISDLEEKILYLMEDEDKIQKEAKDAKSALEEDEEKIKGDERVLIATRENNETKIGLILSSQEELRKQADSELLSRFNIMTSKAPWTGIAGVKDDGICSMCHVKIRPQVFAELMGDEVVNNCDNCNRILYYVSPEIEEE